MPPKKSNPPSIALPRSLRAGRALHPGEPDKPRPKRSTVEVQAERAEKSQAELKRAQARDLDIAQTAEIEEKTRQEYTEKMKNAHHPPESRLTKVLRPRKAPEMASVAPGPNASELLPGEVRDISSNSSEEYQAQNEPDGEDSADSESEQALDASGDEEIAGVKMSNKRQKGSLRKEVNAALKMTRTWILGIGAP